MSTCDMTFLNSHKTLLTNKATRRVTLVSIRSNPVTTGQVYPPKSTHTMTVVNLTDTGRMKF